MENRKKLSDDELWDALAQTGAILPKDEYLKKMESLKKKSLTCDEVIGLMKDKDKRAMFDVMRAYSHVLSCDNCRARYCKDR